MSRDGYADRPGALTLRSLLARPDTDAFLATANDVANLRRVCCRIVKRLRGGQQSIFQDVSSMRPGQDFTVALVVWHGISVTYS